MGKPSIAVVLGGKHEAPESSHDLGDGGEDEYDHLSPEEVDEHGESAAEHLCKAVESGDAKGVWAAFQTMHSLHHAKWEQGEGYGEGEEKEESGED